MAGELFVLGMNAKIYQGVAGAEIGDLDEMDNVKDVTLNLDAGMADVTTRANAGWRANATTLKECSVDWEMLWKPGDPGFEAIKDAFLGSSQIRLAVLTGAWDAEDVAGPIGDFSISKFTRSEPLEDGITVSVTAKLACFDEWYESAGS